MKYYYYPAAMESEGEEFGSHRGSSPVQMQLNYLDGQGRDNSRSMPHSQHQRTDMDNCDWPIHEPDQHQVIDEVRKYSGIHLSFCYFH
ncbi:uncharacterized protein LOC120354746 isoform X2 [Nilaparvata lugens]|uniref:uncharacterized protein LOC120354746 isoform X2 n=1 Tax=Nilaparvata lugens TaxID=108931 RepID=UPI00193E90BE|nr:uncharacterized protein LOC120354746 isoform X2 [Nilaparvata lugens]